MKRAKKKTEWEKIQFFMYSVESKRDGGGKANERDIFNIRPPKNIDFKTDQIVTENM